MKFDRTTYILVAGMTALVIFSVIFIHTLRERNQELQDNLDVAEEKISVLKMLIRSAPMPHPALPGAGDFDNWTGGSWKMVSDNGFVIAGQSEASSDATWWYDEVEKVSKVHFHHKVSGWKSLSFIAIEFSSATPAEDAFVYLKERVENAEQENLYVVSSEEDLIRIEGPYSDATVFRKDKAVFMVDIFGGNPKRWASAPYAEFLKSRIKKCI